MGHPGIRNLVLVAAAGLALVGCETLKKVAGGGDAESRAPEVAGTTASSATQAAAGPVAGQDVEAPELYRASDRGLWDGRPSLGGIWVAAPDVKDPQRVLMKNGANGRTVVGALFRRERENPGPKFQLSSDAATALGLLAGQPATITVTALRRAEPAPAKPAQTAAAPAAGDARPPAKDAAAKGPAAKAAPAVPGAAGRGALVQIASFGKEDNARSAADKLTRAGIPARVRSSKIADKPVWSVVAGPAPTADTAGFVSQIKGLGFPDAYPVSR